MRLTVCAAVVAQLGCLLAAGTPHTATAAENPSQKMSIPIKGNIPEEWKQGGNREFDMHFSTMTVGGVLCLGRRV
jgi:hypothetical protein